MPQVTLDLSDKRYAALTATAALHLPAGTPQDYLQTVVDSACDSYAQTYAEVSIDVYKRRAEEAEALARQEAEKAASAQAKADALEAEKAAVGESLADRIGAL